MLRKCYLSSALPVSRTVDMRVGGFFVCLFVFLKQHFPENNQLPSLKLCSFVWPCSPADPQTGIDDFGRKTLP